MSKTNEKATEFSFLQALENMINSFPKRSQDILKGRFGINKEKPLTLEKIGGKYGITRERVRQIIEEEMKKIKSQKDEDHFNDVRKQIKLAIKQNSGIIKEQEMLNRLGKDTKEQRAVKFFLECLDNIDIKKGGVESDKAIILTDFPFDKWRQVERKVIQLLEEKEDVHSEDELYDVFSQKAEDKVEKKEFVDFLNVSKKVKRNNFGKWGMAQWIEISPKIVWQKAYLVLKENNAPLHFQDIAKSIDSNNLNKRKTHPQTVHNELIKNERFVLVGRGMYALTEWGYEKGTVKDVIASYLEKANAPVHRDDIINEVLKVRTVKKTTVMINLNNFFKKVDKDKYILQ